jgi:hypothetical protein
VISEAERLAWRALDVVAAEEAAHYLASGEPLLKGAVTRQMERDYIAAVTRLLEDVRPHLEGSSVPETPFGFMNHPERIPETETHWLRSLALEETDELLRSGEPEQVLAWITSGAAGFARQRFRRGEIDAWAVNRGLRESRAEGESLPLNPKERTALYRVIALLAASLGLDLSRPSASAARLLEIAAREGMTASVAQRTLEKHFRRANDEIDRSPSQPADDE